jgi:hypothetical protein
MKQILAKKYQPALCLLAGLFAMIVIGHAAPNAIGWFLIFFGIALICVQIRSGYGYRWQISRDDDPILFWLGALMSGGVFISGGIYTIIVGWS